VWLQALTRSLPSTSSESDEFLETCRATTLLTELEDEEDLPEPDDDDDENDDENEDDDDYEDVMVGDFTVCVDFALTPFLCNKYIGFLKIR
jgi:hypothetical protein